MPTTIDIKTDCDIYSDLHAGQGFVWALVGKNGSGTTVTAIQMCRDWKLPTPRTPLNYFRGKLVAFDPMGGLGDLVDYLIDVNDKDWAKRLMEKDENGKYKFQNSLLVLDDYRMLLSGNSTPKDFLDLLMMKKLMGLSIIYVVKSPRHILERLSWFTTHFSIFNMDAKGDFYTKIPAYEICQMATDIINEQVLKNGPGTYPNFPHIIVKPATEQCELRNK